MVVYGMVWVLVKYVFLGLLCPVKPISTRSLKRVGLTPLKRVVVEERACHAWGSTPTQDLHPTRMQPVTPRVSGPSQPAAVTQPLCTPKSELAKLREETDDHFLLHVFSVALQAKQRLTVAVASTHIVFWEATSSQVHCVNAHTLTSSHNPS